MAAAFRFDGVASDFVLGTQLSKFFASQLWIDAVVIVSAVVITIFFVFIFVIVQIFLGEF